MTWNGKDVRPEFRDLPAGRYYQRHPDELLIVRVYHQARRPITR